MVIFKMGDIRQGIRVFGDGESPLENLFVSSFTWKIETSPTNCRNLKYDDVQESHTSPTKTDDISQQ